MSAKTPDNCNAEVMQFIHLLTGRINAGKPVSALDAFSCAVGAKVPMKSVTFRGTSKVKKPAR